MLQRPDVNAALGELKDFQLKTVDYVFHRLYDEGANRFLIADEVGLGKTLVAKGIIARAVDRLWDSVPRIDIVYICSNSDIARQNVNKLNVMGNNHSSLASRITLLPKQLQDLSSSKVNFISFTPGTSFNMHSSTGISTERVLIYHMLRAAWDLGDRKGPQAVLRGNVHWEYWPAELATLQQHEIDPGLRQAFLERLRQAGDIRTRFEALAKRSARSVENPAVELKAEQNRMISELRHLLAESCIHSLEPDIIILDEFQRFKDILDGEDEAARLARTLFNYPNAKVLLLSATPYKMYTMDYERAESDDHYKDLMRTVDFLLDDKDAGQRLRDGLDRYRRELLRAGSEERHRPPSVQGELEQQLRQVMTRTERIGLTAKHDGMLDQIRGLGEAQIAEEDLHSFLLADKVAQVLKGRDVVEYWKSAPYVLNIMDKGAYKLKRELTEALDDPEKEQQLARIMQVHPQALLQWERVQQYRPVNAANARMRQLAAEVIDNDAWQMLWLPAAYPYYKVDEGPYAGPQCGNLTKTLVFSSWQMVPKAIALLLSYEAERRAVELSGLQTGYAELRDRRSPLIRFAHSDGRLTAMNYLTLLYPSPTLAEEFDPLSLLAQCSTPGELARENEVLSLAKGKAQRLLAPVVEEFGVGDDTDARWYWAAPALLDRSRHANVVGAWLDSDQEETAWSSFARSSAKAEADSNFGEHVDMLNTVFKDGLRLGQPPQDLYDVIAKVGLASPAVVTLRSLTRSIASVADLTHLLPVSARVAIGYRSMFNLPETICLLRGLQAGDEMRYWETVLDYCLHGNLQAVMDEYLHYLADGVGVTGLGVHDAIKQVTDVIFAAVSLRTASLEFDEFVLAPDGHEVEVKERKLRCRYALRFGEGRDDEDGQLRADQVRSAFNSPFRPFVLASTSLGQEGLDFHPYCHSLYHWNLPANPVDLEQREGRINRYKGHAVRKNVALAAIQSGKKPMQGDVWKSLFEDARINRPPEANDLIPYWLYECEQGGHKINRSVPSLPMSRELGRMERLRNSVVSYRMVFGQPRQEDLLAFLESRYQSKEQLDELLDRRIRLAPLDVGPDSGSTRV